MIIIGYLGGQILTNKTLEEFKLLSIYLLFSVFKKGASKAAETSGFSRIIIFFLLIVNLLAVIKIQTEGTAAKLSETDVTTLNVTRRYKL